MIKAVIFDMYETLITLFESSAYFGTQMAEDVGIPEKKFQEIWASSETDRTLGKITLEELVDKILKVNNCYSEEKKRNIIHKRIRFKEEAFEHLHPQIIPLLKGLKEQGIKIGLISNCFSEEAMVIEKSILFPYFDVVCLSYHEGLKKPDQKIFKRCLDKLELNAEQCLYVGDGGSNELEAAREAGMQSVQAVWYLKEGTSQPAKRKEEFVNVENPLDIIDMVLK